MHEYFLRQMLFNTFYMGRWLFKLLSNCVMWKSITFSFLAYSLQIFLKFLGIPLRLYQCLVESVCRAVARACDRLANGSVRRPFKSCWSFHAFLVECAALPVQIVGYPAEALVRLVLAVEHHPVCGIGKNTKLCV